MTGPDLRALREQFGLTQVELGRLLGGYAGTAVGFWEMGQRGIPPAVRVLLGVLERAGLER